MGEWMHANEALLWWLLAGSLLCFIGTLVAAPLLILRLPAHYFDAEWRRRPRPAARYPVLRAALFGIKNLLGLTLVLTGLVLLVLPGQGVLTIVIGLTLMNFPGKYQLERWLIERPPVLRGVNWLRRRYRVAPLVIDD